MKKLFNSLIQGILRRSGYSVEYLGRSNSQKSKIDLRPVGKIDYFLHDLRRRGFVPDTILDVGANVGWWSRMAKGVFPDANLNMIEPLEEGRVPLEKFCTDFPGSKYFPFGAGAENSILIFNVTDDLQGSSFMTVRDDSLLASGRQRKIKIVTIDDLISSGEMEIPQLMKLDVQGFELEALKGARSTFGKTEVYILEVSLFHFDDRTPVITDVIKFMDEKEYDVYDFPGFLRRPFDGALGQCDIAFVKRNGFFKKSARWS